MGVHTAIPLEEYLQTTFEGPDREFRDGEVVERSMPDYPHGKCQLLLGAFFVALKKRLSLYPCTETRVRLPNKRVLIPDVAVFHPDEPSDIPDSPPLIAIEILSRDDRMSEMRAKLEEYREWGVPHVWLVDPHGLRLYTCEDKLTEVDALRVPELEIEVHPADILY
jgi:Uma2 family endonuclease